MKTLLRSCIFLLLNLGFLYGQAGSSVWISTGTVHAQIGKDGNLLTDFTVPNGDSIVTGADFLSFWIGGIDPAGYLCLASQVADTAKSDFRLGFRGIPGSARVWKVTKADIEQHLQDFQDNGVIDNPIESVFSWPAEGSATSLDLNGFDMNNVSPDLAAPFANWYSNNDLYNPEQGDFPSFGNIIYNTHRQPDEIVFVPFYEKQEPSVESDKKRFGIECSALFYTYYCDDADFLDHTIFVYIHLHNSSGVQKDSVYAAVVMDGNAGADKQNDYLGFIPAPYGNMLYFYNADTLDEGNPIVYLDNIHGLKDTFGLYTFYHTAMPLYETGSQLPVGTYEPQTVFEYYRYISGTWRDGTPVSAAGSGYNPNSPNLPLTRQIFSGIPGIPGEWSQISAGSQPWNSKGLVSSGPISFKSALNRKTNSLFFSISWTPPAGTMQEQLETMRSYSNDIDNFNYADYFPPDPNPYDALPCFSTTPVQEISERIQIELFPNPANNKIWIASGGIPVKHLAFYNMLGHMIFESTGLTEDITEIPVHNWEGGLYFVRAVLENGGIARNKLIIKH